MKAIWNGEVLAESGDTVIVEGTHYFPPESLRMDCFSVSDHTSTCSWKGTASYYNINVGGQGNKDAAWFYADPKAAAAEIKDRVAFWRGVEVVE